MPRLTMAKLQADNEALKKELARKDARVLSLESALTRRTSELTVTSRRFDQLLNIMEWGAKEGRFPRA